VPGPAFVLARARLLSEAQKFQPLLIIGLVMHRLYLLCDLLIYISCNLCITIFSQFKCSE
jgi:hypothetical protein